MRRGWSALRGPTLLILSDADLTAAQFRALVSEDARWRDLQQRHGVTTCVLEGADHTFSTATTLEDSTNAVLGGCHRRLMARIQENGDVTTGRGRR